MKEHHGIHTGVESPHWLARSVRVYPYTLDVSSLAWPLGIAEDYAVAMSLNPTLLS